MPEAWLQVVSLFLANAALILWFRSESRADLRHMDAKMEENKKETNEILRAIQSEIREFHGRLCAIEERNKK